VLQFYFRVFLITYDKLYIPQQGPGRFLRTTVTNRHLCITNFAQRKRAIYTLGDSYVMGSC